MAAKAPARAASAATPRKQDEPKPAAEPATTPRKAEPAAASAAPPASGGAGPAAEGRRGGGGSAPAGEDGESRERRKRAALKQFYQTPAPTASSDPLDIDGPNFNADQYLQKLYRQYDLNVLMKKEDEFGQQMRVRGVHQRMKEAWIWSVV